MKSLVVAVVAETVVAETVAAEAVAAERVDPAEAVAVVLSLFAQPLSLRHSHKMDTFPFYLHKQQVVLSCESIEDR